MKNIILVVLLLIATLTITTGFLPGRPNQMRDVQLNIKDLPEYGLVIIGPNDSSYGEVVNTLLPRVPKASLEAAKSFSFIVKNASSKILVAYSIKWEMVGLDGRVATHRNDYIAPGFFSGGGVSGLTKVIGPNAARVFSLASALEIAQDPDNKRGGGFAQGGRVITDRTKPPTLEAMIEPQIDSVKSTLSRYKTITVSIDGAFFEDGTFVGANSTGFFDNVKALRDAKRNMLEDLRREAGQNKSADEIFDGIMQIAYRPRTPFNAKSSAAEKYNHYLQRYALELIEMKKFSGSEKALQRELKNLDRPWPELRKL